MRSYTALFICIVVLLETILYGCEDGKEGPLLSAQICVRDKNGMKLMFEELQAIASAKHMQYVDNSTKTQRDLRAVGYAHLVDPVVNISVERADGLGVGATNVGLPTFQIALGFTEGSNPEESRDFADGVIRRLEVHWHVERMPANLGVTPDNNCR